MEKGYYADGEDAYDMRLPFTQNASLTSGVKPMTPLKQVVAVKPSAEKAKQVEDDPKKPTVEGNEEEKAKEEETEGSEEESAVDGVAKKIEELSVETAAAKA